MNMSYCRFQNTLSDLKDCYDNLPDGDLSRDEANAFAELILLVKDIAERYEDIDDYHELKDLAIENYKNEE